MDTWYFAVTDLNALLDMLLDCLESHRAFHGSCILESSRLRFVFVSEDAHAILNKCWEVEVSTAASTRMLRLHFYIVHGCLLFNVIVCIYPDKRGVPE